MKPVNKLFQILIFVGTALFILLAHADDQQEINNLTNNIYSEHLKALLCIKEGEDSSIDKQLIAVSAKYFSIELLKSYQVICFGNESFPTMDFRTGELGAFSDIDSEAGFTNLHIEQPKIKGTHATIHTTYDLPVAAYEQFKNFTLFTLIKENGQWKIDDIELGCHDTDKDSSREYLTSLPTIKSLKKYIRKGLAEHKAAKKASEK